MTPLRVGILCFPTFGGSGVIATDVGVGIARRGHRVHVLSYDVPGRLDRFQENVVVHEVAVRDYPVLHQVPYPLALASKIVEVARREGLDLVHVHYAVPHATSAYLARQILGDAAPPVVTTLHGTDITLVGSDSSLLPITRFSVLASQALTTPSEFLKGETYRRLELAPDVAIEVIANFVDEDRFRPPEGEPACIRHLLGLPASAPGPGIVAHVSNFRPLKRIDYVLRVFAEARRFADARLLLIGDGPEHSQAVDLSRALGVEREVHFLGKQHSFVELLQASDVFLLPSETESFGLAALEAMACGVPVVASDVGGLPEVVESGTSGFLEPVGDVARMAERVAAILTDRALRDRLGRAARARVESRFRTAPAIDRYLELYRRVLG